MKKVFLLTGLCLLVFSSCGSEQENAIDLELNFSRALVEYNQEDSEGKITLYELKTGSKSDHVQEDISDLFNLSIDRELLEKYYHAKSLIAIEESFYEENGSVNLQIDFFKDEDFEDNQLMEEINQNILHTSKEESPSLTVISETQYELKTDPALSQDSESLQPYFKDIDTWNKFSGLETQETMNNSCQENEEVALVCTEDDAFGHNQSSPVGNLKFTYEPYRGSPGAPGCVDCVEIPSNIMVEIWEHSCVEHIKACDLEKAEGVLDTMNWQCNKFEGFVTSSQDVSEAEQRLAEARDAKTEAYLNGEPFLCDSIYFTERSLDYIKCIDPNSDLAPLEESSESADSSNNSSEIDDASEITIATSNDSTPSDEVTLKEFVGDNFIGKKVKVASDFYERLENVDKYAGNHNIKLYITSSYRSSTIVEGAIVKPAEKSNHLVGHAIDFNIVYKTTNGKSILCNSKCLRQKFEDLPCDIQAFIADIRNDGELRWGGDFKKIDVVHIDDNLNISNETYWNELYKKLQAL